MKKGILGLSVSLLLGGAILAQSTFVVPPGYATKEGGSYHWMVGRYTLGRAQQVIPKKFLPSNPLVIKSFKMRRDGTRTTAYEAHKIDIEVYMSNNPNTDPPTGYSMVFESNHGPDKTKVMNKKTINWPAEPKPTNPPAPFKILFPFDKPFSFKAKALVIDWILTRNSASPKKYYYWYVDAVYHGWYSNGPKTNTPVTKGTGCPTNYSNYGYYPYVGGRLWLYGYSRVNKKKLPGFMIIGSNDKTYGGINLPFDLTPLGAPGCKLYIDVVTTFASFTDPQSSTGYIFFRMGCIPNDKIFEGAKFYCQQLVLDPSYNALGVRMSPYRIYTIGKGFSGKGDGFCFYAYDFNSPPIHYIPGQCHAFYWTQRTNVIEFTY